MVCPLHSESLNVRMLRALQLATAQRTRALATVSLPKFRYRRVTGHCQLGHLDADKLASTIPAAVAAVAAVATHRVWTGLQQARGPHSNRAAALNKAATA